MAGRIVTGTSSTATGAIFEGAFAMSFAMLKIGKGAGSVQQMKGSFM
jgi:hypothetical protein